MPKLIRAWEQLLRVSQEAACAPAIDLRLACVAAMLVPLTIYISKVVPTHTDCETTADK